MCVQRYKTVPEYYFQPISIPMATETWYRIWRNKFSSSRRWKKATRTTHFIVTYEVKRRLVKIGTSDGDKFLMTVKTTITHTRKVLTKLDGRAHYDESRRRTVIRSVVDLS